MQISLKVGLSVIIAMMTPRNCWGTLSFVLAANTNYDLIVLLSFVIRSRQVTGCGNPTICWLKVNNLLFRVCLPANEQQQQVDSRQLIYLWVRRFPLQGTIKVCVYSCTRDLPLRIAIPNVKAPDTIAVPRKVLDASDGRIEKKLCTNCCDRSND